MVRTGEIRKQSKSKIPEQEIRDVLARLGVGYWYQGDDGFGGEWIVPEEKVTFLRQYFKQKGLEVE